MKDALLRLLQRTDAKWTKRELKMIQSAIIGARLRGKDAGADKALVEQHIVQHAPEIVKSELAGMADYYARFIPSGRESVESAKRQEAEAAVRAPGSASHQNATEFRERHEKYLAEHEKKAKQYSDLHARISSEGIPKEAMTTKVHEHFEPISESAWDESKHPRDEQGKFT